MRHTMLWSGAFLWAVSLCAGESPAMLYQRACAMLRAGDVPAAESLFTELSTDRRYGARARRGLTTCRLRREESSRENGLRTEAVARARELLDSRRAILSRMGERYPTVIVNEGPERTLFAASMEDLFVAQDATLSLSGEGILGLIKDYAGTFRTVTLTVTALKTSRTSEEAFRRQTRRAVRVATTLFRQVGLPPQNIRLRSAPSEREGMRLTVETVPSPAAPGEADLSAVQVDLRAARVDLGRESGAGIDLSLLDSDRIHAWTLKILNAATGRAVRAYNGTSDVWVALSWDGLDDTGRPAPAGEYQVVLTARSYGGAARLDSVPLWIRRPERAAPPTAPAVSERGRRWSQVVAFSYGRSEVGGSSQLDLQRLAENIRSFPDERVVVEGHADESEPDARRLAEARARAVLDALVGRYGVSAERLSIRVPDPRRALEGERLQKAVAYFVEKTP